MVGGVVDRHTVGIGSEQEGIHAAVDVDAGACQSAAALDGAADAASGDSDVGVALHATSGAVGV